MSVENTDLNPHFDAARRHELVIPQCDHCGRFRWPPRTLCPTCHHFSVTWQAVESSGSLFTWTVVWHQSSPQHPPPYAVGLVQLDQVPYVRLLGNIVMIDTGALRVGLPLKAMYQESTSRTLINWTPSAPMTRHASALIDRTSSVLEVKGAE